jgi:hypothetical protein
MHTSLKNNTALVLLTNLMVMAEEEMTDAKL